MAWSFSCGRTDIDELRSVLAISNPTETIRAFDAGKVRSGDMIRETIDLHSLPAMLEEIQGAHNHLKVQFAPNLG